MQAMLEQIEKFTPQQFVELKQAYQKTVRRYWYPSGAMTASANSVVSTYTITFSNAAGFYCTALSGTYTYGNTSAPLCSVLLTDLSNGGVRFTNDYVPLSNLVSPGLNTNALYEPTPVEWFFDRNGTLQIDLKNSDTADVTVNLTFHGFWIQY